MNITNDKYLISSTRLLIFSLVDQELKRAATLHTTQLDGNQDGFHSLHEAYAVMEEELDEVWEIVKQKQQERSNSDLRKELVQLAAMAIKTLESENIFVGKD